MNQQQLMRYAAEAGPRLLWLNVAHLFSVSLLPLVAACMAVSELAPQPVPAARLLSQAGCTRRGEASAAVSAANVRCRTDIRVSAVTADPPVTPYSALSRLPAGVARHSLVRRRQVCTLVKRCCERSISHGTLA
jgi:hypothetical protein